MNPVVVLGQAVSGAEAMPGVETSATTEAIKYGIVGVLCLVFAYVIVFLYKENRADRREAAENEKKHATEMTACKEQCKAEKEAMRADFEKRHREVLEGYTSQLTQLRASYDKREEDLRRHYETMMERLANANKESADALVEMLQQFLTKVVK